MRKSALGAGGFFIMAGVITPGQKKSPAVVVSTAGLVYTQRASLGGKGSPLNDNGLASGWLLDFCTK